MRQDVGVVGAGEFVADRLKRVFFAGHENELGPFGGHLPGAFRPEAETAAGNDGHFVFELEINRHARPLIAVPCHSLMERGGAGVNAHQGGE